jgi:hypothetical protein
MSFDPEIAYDALIRAGEDWADKQAAAELLEETKKSVLARLMISADATSQGQREMLALADEEYTDFITGMVTARKAANKARVRYDSAKVLAELRRSQEATRRAEASIR